MVRTRFAPSPTGNQHIGNFRTALYAYMWAKKNKGTFIVRTEDTDRKRFVPGSAKATIELFSQYGLSVDEHATDAQIKLMEEKMPTVDQKWILEGKKLEDIDEKKYENIYVQTQRLPLYLKYAWKLVKQGSAYLCFCSEERLKELREEQSKKKGKTMYDGHCKKFSLDEALAKVKDGEKYVIRLDIDAFGKKHHVTKVDYDEPIFGKMRFPIEDIDDQILIKSNGIPTYHLAVVVDDHLMGITHAMRGYGWLPSTPKQVMLYRELGWPLIPYYHFTDILDPAGGKLSKRHGAVAAIDFLREGYVPEAILNFLAFLGWTPDVKRDYGESERELYPFKELIRLFSLNDFNKSNPVFNREKLLWFNAEYIKRYSKTVLTEKVVEWFKKYCQDVVMKKNVITDKYLLEKVALFRERTRLLSELVEGLRFFYKFPDVPNPKDVKGLSRYEEADYKKIIEEYIPIVEGYANDSKRWKQEEWVAHVRKLAEKYEWKAGDIFMMIRIIICGSPISPPLFESMQILRKKEVVMRLKRFVDSSEGT